MEKKKVILLRYGENFLKGKNRNLFEKRLANLETYLMKLPPKEPLVSHQSSEPASAAAGTHWTSTEADTHDIGTWSAASHYTWNELSNYTWKQVGKL